MRDVESDALIDFIEKVERLEEEKRSIQEGIKEVYDEARGVGLEPKIMRQLIKLRKMDADKFKEHEVLMVVYKKAVGMLVSIDTMMMEETI